MTAKIKLFTQENCPRCGPVKQTIKDLSAEREIDIHEVNAGTDEGMFEAIKYNIMTTPAVVVGNKLREIRIVGDISKESIISTLDELGG
ncbi:MAG: thioredoxin family protein [Candidatus Micrarchaeota archaeon]